MGSKLSQTRPALEVPLEDLPATTLKVFCIQAGLPVEGTKGELAESLKAHLSPNVPLVFVPKADILIASRWTRFCGSAPGWAVVVSVLSLLALGIGTYRAVDKMNREIEIERKEEWRQTKTCSIIDKYTLTAEKYSGLTFDEIKSRYAEAVNAEKFVDLGKDDLQDDELK